MIRATIILFAVAAITSTIGCSRGSDEAPSGGATAETTPEPAPPEAPPAETPPASAEAAPAGDAGAAAGDAAPAEDEELPVAEDFEEEAETEITADNYRQQLDSLAAEIEAVDS